MKKTNSSKIYQFKIILQDTNPSVWRVIQVPENYSFWDLHVAIQDAMGWSDCHLHDFILKNPADGREAHIGIPDEDGEFGSDRELLTDWEQNISEWFTLENNQADYTYDFGDGWEHTVILEKILPRAAGVKYPICVYGERACPPEDCGSYAGYESICAGTHEYQKEYKYYDPEYFDPEEIDFVNPKERLKTMQETS
jgi:hypothetical protein